MIGFGIDLDNPSQLKLLKSIFNALYVSQFITIAESPSGTGYHIRAYTHRKLTREENFTLRAWAGDDPTRLMLDEKRPNDWIDTLYHTKIKEPRRKHRTGTENPLTIRDILALPFWSKLPRETWIKRKDKK